MRQEPSNYLIIGNGRIAKHFSHYFELLNIPYSSWNRSKNTQTQLTTLIDQNIQILLCISDSSIEFFIKEHAEKLKSKNIVHFSGSLFFEIEPLNIFGIHPLMTFGQEVYNLETYESIHFFCDREKVFFNIFPKLKNASHFIPPSKKSLYHAFCVMSGNFTQILWKGIESEFNKNFDFPSEALQAYQKQVFEGLMSSHTDQITGPFVREDQVAIDSNLASLPTEPLKNIYEDFYKYFKSSPKDIWQ